MRSIERVYGHLLDENVYLSAVFGDTSEKGLENGPSNWVVKNIPAKYFSITTLVSVAVDCKIFVVILSIISRKTIIFKVRID